MRSRPLRTGTRCTRDRGTRAGSPIVLGRRWRSMPCAALAASSGLPGTLCLRPLEGLAALDT